VSISGSAPSQTLSFVLPQGPQGIQGPQGPVGTANLADETPQPLGTASAGTALTAARADHVHDVGSIQYSSLAGIPSTFAPSAHTHAVSDVTGLQAALDGKQAAGTYATLVGGTVPSSQLPSYVDDVIEYANLAAFTEQSTGKIYVARDTGKIYRWSGSAYIEISPSPGSTDSVTEGSTNLYFTNARAAAAAPVQSVQSRTGAVVLTKSDVGLSNVTNVDATQRSNHTGTQTASTISDFAAEAAKYGPVVSVVGRTGAISLSTSDITGLQTALDGKQAAGNYVTSVNSLYGGVKLAAGTNIAITASGQTITIASTGIGANDVVDGGWYYGVSGYTKSITITLAPIDKTASSGAASFTATAIVEPSGTPIYQWQKSDANSIVVSDGLMPSNDHWTSVTYGGGKFVAITYSTSISAVSTDGINWTQGNLPTRGSGVWRDVAYGSGIFVAVTDSGTVATSTDGANWTQRTMQSIGARSITYGGGKFVAVGFTATDNNVATSTNGIEWTVGTLGNGYESVTYGAGVFVAVRGSGAYAAVSTNGIDWTSTEMPQAAFWSGVAYGNGLFVAVSNSPVAGNEGLPTAAATSTDGVHWTARQMPVSSYGFERWSDIAYGNGYFVVVASTGYSSAVSTDGINWSLVSMPSGVTAESVTYGSAGKFVAVESANISANSLIIEVGVPSLFANISGASSQTLSLSGLTKASDNGDRFRVVVSAAGAASVTSRPVTLTVQ
jgi:hypothetical protein